MLFATRLNLQMDGKVLVVEISKQNLLVHLDRL